METSRFLVFYQAMSRILKDIKRVEMSYLSEFGLRSAHMGCLLYIKQSEKGMTITQLSKSCKTDKALISRTVKELISSDFIVTNSADKTYNKKYVLTQKGEMIVSNIKKDIVEYMARARAGISDKDMLEFYEVLTTLENNISLIASDEQ